jgi:trimethylamine--corrinoid protein Co-methyltransferase
LDSDIYHRIRFETAGLEIGSAELAVDVIKEVGPRGHFLKHRHTREFIRQHHFSDLTAQPAPGGGYQDPIELARKKVDMILEGHHPAPLEMAQQQELQRVLQAADREFAAPSVSTTY